MTRWTVNLGVPSVIGTNTSGYRAAEWSEPAPIAGRYKLSAALVPPNVSRWFTYLNIVAGGSRPGVSLNFAPSASSDANDADLSDAWERSGTATLRVGSFSIVLPTPSDMTEPYHWGSSEVSTATLRTWITNVESLAASSRRLSLTIDDNVVPAAGRTWTGPIQGPTHVGYTHATEGIATEAIWGSSTPAGPIPAFLTASGRSDLYIEIQLDRYSRYLPSGVREGWTLSLHVTDSSSTFLRGEDLSDAWETQGKFTLVVGSGAGNLTYTFGPFADMANIYNSTQPLTGQDQINAVNFIAAIRALPAAQRTSTLTLDDGVLGKVVRASGTLPRLSGSARLHGRMQVVPSRPIAPTLTVRTNGDIYAESTRPFDGNSPNRLRLADS